MIDVFCLSPDETTSVLADLAIGKSIEDVADLKSARFWETKTVTLSLFIAWFIERQLGDGIECKVAVNSLYDSDGLNLIIDEFGVEFIEFMLRHIRQPDVSLADDLLAHQRRYHSYDYSSALRY